MPFLQAGFNGKHLALGIFAWTRARSAEKPRWAAAELIRFESGDYAWHGERFLAWGEACVFGTHAGFVLADEHQHGLEQCDLDDKPRPGRKVSFTIIGEPASKANSRELVMRGPKYARRPMFIKSEKALDYERSALMQVPPMARLRMEGPMRVTMRIFYASNRPDLDESLVLDILQDRFTKVGEGEDAKRVLIQKGVYRNDRQVKEKHVFWGYDQRNPRAEIEVEPIEAPIFQQQLEAA